MPRSTLELAYQHFVGDAEELPGFALVTATIALIKRALRAHELTRMRTRAPGVPLVCARLGDLDTPHRSSAPPYAAVHNGWLRGVAVFALRLALAELLLGDNVAMKSQTAGAAAAKSLAAPAPQAEAAV